MPYLVRFPRPHHKAAAPDCAVYRVDERGRLWLRSPAIQPPVTHVASRRR